MPSKIKQPELIAAICNEVGRQRPGAKINTRQLAKLATVANQIIHIFDGVDDDEQDAPQPDVR